MLDAVLVASNANAYTHGDWATARAVGYAIKSSTGTMGRFDGTHWRRFDTNQLMRWDFIVDPSYPNNIAGNGLAYDNVEGGQRNQQSARDYCASKGMRLPSIAETRAGAFNGVPSHATIHTWANEYTGDLGYRYLGSSGAYGSRIYHNTIATRCVR